MGTNRIQRMDEIEQWRAKAYMLSRSDRLGRLLTKSFDLAQTIVSEGLRADNLPAVVESLLRENSKAMHEDPSKDEIMRAMVYGLSHSMVAMIESIIETLDGQAEYQDTTGPLEQEDPNVKMEMLDDYNADEDLNLTNLERLHPELFNDKNDVFTANSDAVNLIDAPGTSKEEEDEEPGSSSTVTNNRRRSSRSITKNEEDMAKKSRYVEEDEEQEDDNDGEDAEFGSSTVNESRSEVFNCDKCDMEFASKRSLARHAVVHKAYKCDECGNRMTSQDTLIKHYTEQHPGKNPSWNSMVESDRGSLECTFCDRKFSKLRDLERHLTSHSSVKQFVCDKCPTAFKRADKLNRHLREKHGENPHECEDCGLKFKYHIEMKNHAHIHYDKSNEII